MEEQRPTKPEDRWRRPEERWRRPVEVRNTYIEQVNSEKEKWQPKDEPKSRIFPKFFWVILIIFFIALGVIFAKAYNLSVKVFGSNVSFFQRVSDIIFNRSASLQGESDGQINILLLGYGGAGHDGPYLTDSMILASINLNSKQILLTSIPRDLEWPLSTGDEKINQIFADGYAQTSDFNKAGSGAEQAVAELSGEKIPYYAALDFEGFTQAVDKIGGLDINVPDGFTDYAYPNDATGGYLPPQTFDAGQQHMDGARALIYARSRHAAGPEGSDFARSKRQELIIEAFKNKVLSMNLLKNSGTFNDLLNILASHFHTNMQPSEILRLGDLINGQGFKISTQSLDESTGLLCETNNGVFYLIPCQGISASDIQSFIKGGLSTASVRDEQTSIIMENANGNDYTLYDQIKKQLTALGVTVYDVPYKGFPLGQSVLYEVNSKPATEQFIEKTLNIQSQPKPQKMIAKTDLVLIIGGSAPSGN